MEPPEQKATPVVETSVNSLKELWVCRDLVTLPNDFIEASPLDQHFGIQNIRDATELVPIDPQEVLQDIMKASVWIQQEAVFYVSMHSNFPMWKTLFRDQEIRETFVDHTAALSKLYMHAIREHPPGTAFHMGELEKYLRWCQFSGLLAIPMTHEALFPWSFEETEGGRGVGFIYNA